MREAPTNDPATRTEVARPLPAMPRPAMPRPAMPLLIAAALLMVCRMSAQAQILVPGLNQEKQEPADDLQRLPTDRRVVQHLQELSVAAGTGDISTVRDLLERLRAADPMLMVPQDRGTFVPLHRDLISRILLFPAEITRDLELQSTVADTALQQALSREGISGLIPVLHRYSGTHASLRAHLLLAAVHGDRGHAQVAEYWLVPVLASRTADDLKATAERLRTRFLGTKSDESDAASGRPQKRQGAADPNAPDADVPDADASETQREKPDESATLPVDPPEPEAGLDRLPGQPPGAVPSATPENLARHMHWMQALPLAARAKKLSQDLVQGSPEHRIVPWSAWEPVVDDQNIYVRTPDLISAFDRRTGQHVWTRTINRKKSTTPEFDDDMPMFRLPMNETALNSAMNSPEIQLLHRNELIGRMTADSSRLFAVCQIVDATPLSAANGAIPLRLMIGRGDRITAGLWEMIAIDKESGRRLWTMGGPPVEEQFGNELAMAWFAGPPAVHRDQLFGVVEQKGVIQLTCMSAETGHLNWMIPLVYPETEIALDPVRQLLAARVQAEAGMVLTTTTTGWIFAVDSVTRSVLWSRRLPPAQTGMPEIRSLRNPAIFQMQMQPLGQVWRSESPRLFQGTLIVASAESRQLLVLNPVNGEIRYRFSAAAATLVLYLDQNILIVASPDSIVGRQLPDMKKLWTTARTPGQAVPVGHGVRSGDHLLIPLSDGSLEAIHPADGRIAETLEGLRPSFSSGGLFAAGSDVVSYGPNHLALLSSSPADRLQDPDPLDQATFLVETGRLTDARDVLSQVVVDALNAEPVRRLRFRIAIGLFASADVKTAASLEEISAAAQTHEERALSHFLQLEYQLMQSSETVVESLIGVLRKEEEAILAVAIPETKALYATLRTSTAENPLAVSSLTSGAATLRRPLRSWILQQLHRLLARAEGDQKDAILQNIGQLADEDVLGMHSPELVSEYLRRAEGHVQNGTLVETTLHLLSAAVMSAEENSAVSDVAISPEVAQRLKTLLDRLQILSSGMPEKDAGQTLVDRQMLEVLRYDLLAALDVEDPPAPSAPREAVADRWAQVGDPSYTMLPVSTVGQMSIRTPNVRPLELRAADDRFLSAFDWSLRREPGALIARSAADPGIPAWSLKTNVGENAFLQSDEEVMRFGSVVVLQDMLGLSAFSIIDHRRLWSRRMPGGVRRSVLSLVNRPFRDYNAILNADTIYGQGRRICGASDRWICLLSEGSLEVVDLLNGRQLWAMSGFKTTSSVIATDTMIFTFGLGTEDCFTINPADGSATRHAWRSGISELGTKAICGSGDALVVWNTGTFANRERSIDWIDPRTSEVIKSVEMADMEYAQFLDPETLVAVTGEQTFHVVSLKTGNHQTLSFAKPEDDDSTDPAVERVSIAADAANYYVFERSDDRFPMMAGTMYGLRAEQIRKELRAVSRRSGQLAWVRPAEDNTLACIRGGSDPVMLIVRILANPQQNPAMIPGFPMQNGQRYQIDGVSRTTGNTLLNYPVVAQVPFPGLRLTRSNDGQLDLEAFGNRVRFLPATPASAPENN